MSRVVPVDTPTAAISGLDELQAHLDALQQDASLSFNPKLFDDVELQLTEENTPPLLPALLPPLTQILKATTQDPTPLLSLTIKLLRPLPFLRVLTIADPPSLLTALQSPLPGANLLALSILHKAASSPSDAAVLAELPDLVLQLLRLWLEAGDTGVGEKAAKVLGDVLEIDCDVPSSDHQRGGMPNGVNGVNVNGLEVVRRRVPGHGRVWSLLFGQREFVSVIPEFCAASPSSSRSTHQVTISQGRLLRLLPRLSTLSLRPLTSTPFPDLFPLPSSVSSSSAQIHPALLPWAALAMIDKQDMLMHLMLIDFFETFVSVMRVADRTRGADEFVKTLLAAACRDDQQLTQTLRGLPDRTVEEEAEPLRRYLNEMLS